MTVGLVVGTSVGADDGSVGSMAGLAVLVGKAVGAGVGDGVGPRLMTLWTLKNVVPRTQPQLNVYVTRARQVLISI